MPLTGNTIAQQQTIWEHLAPRGKPCTFQRREVIYTPDQPARTLYLVVAGQVNLHLLSASGRVLMLDVIEPGNMFGHSVLMQNSLYDSFAEGSKPVEVVAVARDEVHTALRQHPALGLPLIDMLVSYRETISRLLDEVAFKSVPARLASLLLDMAAAAPDPTQLQLPHRTHQQLAEMINAYRETVTKVISQFRAARLLDIDRSGITLLNPSRLRELAQS
jgi:CRP-like cAMP-binding protein